MKTDCYLFFLLVLCVCIVVDVVFFFLGYRKGRMNILLGMEYLEIGNGWNDEELKKKTRNNNNNLKRKKNKSAEKKKKSRGAV